MRWLRDYGLPEFEVKTKRVVRIYGAVQDITEQKRTQEALRHQEHFFRSLIENSSDVFATVKADGTVDYLSPPYERVLGYVPEERIGGGMFDNLHPDDIPDIVPRVEAIAGESRQNAAL